VTVEGEFYHKSCFRCSHGGCCITPSSYAALDGILYCKAHFAQLFKQKGSYIYLTKTATMKKNAVNLPEEKSEAEENNETVPEANADANSDLAIDKRHHNSWECAELVLNAVLFLSHASLGDIEVTRVVAFLVPTQACVNREWEPGILFRLGIWKLNRDFCNISIFAGAVDERK